MLALTECNTARSHIRAAMVENPVLDWTDVLPVDGTLKIDDNQAAKLAKTGRPKATDPLERRMATLDSLMACRSDIFQRLEHFFDPFASPLLFFRTPCFDLPHQQQMHSRAPPPLASKNSAAAESQAEATHVIERKRTYRRAHPPQGSSLALPSIRLTTGKDWVLKHQAQELANYMRSSNIRAKNSFPQLNDQAIEPETTVEEKEDLGLWDKQDVIRAGHWLGEMLRKR
ncbi:uncharacterized protein KY384_002686 [Bacidia gigantensis]|uniref:uncharacterized protein n=1 Tax=Bacidia gigantensis TaxID=2732470 RepID=UPI001D0360C4|nr:uncharacterized protein KY384_002686 [Bacidia gigantensis]KAG8532808.1 hypothetical protein KY384_002686 [Bacidia gigantensis]